MKNPLEWTKVQEVTYAKNRYLKDIPLSRLVDAYCKDREPVLYGQFKAKGIIHWLRYHPNNDLLIVDGEAVDAETFVSYFEEEEQINERIRQITEIDLDDYIHEIVYEDGKVEYRIPGTGETID